MTEQEQIELNFKSYEFYSKECIAKEKTFLSEYDRITNDESWEELDNLLMLGKTYLTLSNKFLSEIDNLISQMPQLAPLLEGRIEKSFMDTYTDSVEQAKDAQTIVHQKIGHQVRMLESLKNSGGYGSYE